MLCKHKSRTHIRSEPRPCGFWWIIERCNDCGKWFKRAVKEEPHPVGSGGRKTTTIIIPQKGAQHNEG